MKKLVLVATLALAAVSAKANVILNENFTYPDGAIVGAAGSPWLNNTGTAGSALVGTNQLLLSTSRTEDITAPLSGGPYDTNAAISVLYSSFSVKFSQLPTTNGAYFAHFKDGFSGFRARIWASATNAALGSFRLSIVNSSTGSAGSGQLGTDLSLNTTYTVVTRYNLASGISTLWINPSSELDASVSAVDTVGLTNITHYSFRQATGIGTMAVDDLKVGTAFTDVVIGNSTLNPPTISAFANQTIAANGSTGPINFTVTDGETAAADLTLSGTSSNTTLVPNGNIVFGGSSSNRTVTVTPASGQQGVALITITVQDSNNNTSSRSFTLKVGTPSISSIATQHITVNTATAPIAFSVSDNETAAGSLTVSATSSNTTLVPNANISFGGSGGNRTVTITPAADQIGVTTITVTVTDGIQSETTSFVVTVSAVLGLILDEPFTYPDAPIADGSTAWINHSGTFGQTLVASGKLLMNATNSEDFNRELPGRPFAPTNAAVLYTSFDVNFSQRPSSEYFAHYKDTQVSIFRGKIYSTTNGAAPGKFRIGIANSVSTVNTVLARDLDLATTYKVVTKFSIGTGITTLWIDPSNEASSNVTATDSPSDLVVVDSFAFRQSAGIGTFTVDNLKIGGSFSNVVEVVAPPPSMSVAKNGNTITLSWSTADAGYVLQSVNTINGTWGTASETPVQNGNTYTVTINTASGNNFYRLRKP